MADYIPYGELTEEQKEFVDSPGYDWRAVAAIRRWGLDKLVNDSHEFVRSLVALEGYGLDRLVDDSQWLVREAVAKQGYGLEKLVNDPEELVRMTVALVGYGLDKLANDEDDRVLEYVWGKFHHDCGELQAWIAENPDKCALDVNRIPNQKSVADELASMDNPTVSVDNQSKNKAR